MDSGVRSMDASGPSVFISYSHVDNTPPTSRPKVSTFVRRLFDDLKYELTILGLPKDGAWLDLKLKHAENFTDVIRKALLQSDILLAVVSRQYTQSEFCASEIATFAERLGSCRKKNVPAESFGWISKKCPMTRCPCLCVTFRLPDFIG
jgi:hypothetical protein